MEMQGNIYDEIRILLMLYSYKPLDLIEDINILNRFTCAPVTPILAQKLFTASGGNPLRLKAVKVNSRGSSQSRQIPRKFNKLLLLTHEQLYKICELYRT